MYFDIGIGEIQQSAVNWIGTFLPLSYVVIGLMVAVLAMAGLIHLVAKAVRS